jgi:hypothetical protein
MVPLTNIAGSMTRSSRPCQQIRSQIVLGVYLTVKIGLSVSPHAVLSCHPLSNSDLHRRIYVKYFHIKI